MEAPNHSISLILFGYGFISIFSNILAGKIASHNAIGRLRFVFLVQAVVLTSLFWTTNHFILGLVNIGLMSLTAILLTTSTQLYLIDLAGIYQPKATGLAASLMPVASNRRYRFWFSNRRNCIPSREFNECSMGWWVSCSLCKSANLL